MAHSVQPGTADLESSGSPLLDTRSCSERLHSPDSSQIYGPHHKDDAFRSVPGTFGHESLHSTHHESSTNTVRPPSHRSNAKHPQIQRPKRGRLSFSHASDTWVYETVSVMLSMMNLGAIVSILLVVNGKAISSWKFPIQPNSLISIFAVVTKASLVFPIAECISQQKWMLFGASQPKSLIRLEQFDSASRGPWGSWLLLWHTRSDALAGSILAFLTILAFAIDPFAQQIIHISDRIASDPQALAFTYVTRDYNSDIGLYALRQIESGMQGAILMGVYGRPLDSLYVCTTGNCTYPEVTTLGVCGSCQGVAGLTTHSWHSGWNSSIGWTNITTPGGFNIINKCGTVHGLQGSSLCPMFTSSVSLLNEYPKLVSFAAWSRWPSWNESIYECELEFCERLYVDSNLTNGVHTKPTISERKLRKKYKNDYDKINPLISYEPIRTGSGNFTTYMIAMNDMEVISQTLKYLFNSSTRAEVRDSIPMGFDIFGAMQEKSPNILVQEVAESMTSYLRSKLWAKRERVPGTALRREARISVRWLWLSLPVALVALGAMMLLWTIRCNGTRGIPIWKSSSLPSILLSTAMGDQLSLDVQDLEKLSEIWDAARRTALHLVRDEDGKIRLYVNEAGGKS